MTTSLAGVVAVGSPPMAERVARELCGPGAIQPDDGKQLWLSGGCRSTASRRTDGSAGVVTLGIVGRIDNREEIVCQLGVDRAADLCAVIAAAYERWKRALFARLIGDWAIALHDRDDDRVYLARDYPGLIPLYVYESAELRAWSTDLRALVRAVGPVTCDATYLAEFAAGGLNSSRTPYEGISRIPGGGGMCVTDRGAAAFTVYDPFARPRGEGSNESLPDVAAQFAALLERSIRDRLQDPAKCCIELSGGLDSSSVVLLADAYCRNAGRRADSVSTVTYMWRDRSAEVDKHYADIVNRHTAFRNVCLDLEHRWWWHDPDDNGMVPVLPTGQMGRDSAIDELCRAEGIEMMMTGHGGDEIGWSLNRPYAVIADLLSARRPVAAWREALDESRSLRCTVWELFWQDGVKLRGLLRRLRTQMYLGAAPWLRVVPRSRPSGNDEVPQRPSVEMLRLFVDVTRQIVNDDVRVAASPHRMLCPFLDRRVIDFACDIPVRLKARRGRNRVIHRLALQGVLPKELADRRLKSGWVSDLMRRQLIANWSRIQPLFKSNCVLGEMNIVDVDRLRLGAEGVMKGGGTELIPLVRALSLEIWLRRSIRHGTLA